MAVPDNAKNPFHIRLRIIRSQIMQVDQLPTSCARVVQRHVFARRGDEHDQLAQAVGSIRNICRCNRLDLFDRQKRQVPSEPRHSRPT
jgi:hypothetical protein